MVETRTCLELSADRST